MNGSTGHLPPPAEVTVSCAGLTTAQVCLGSTRDTWPWRLAGAASSRRVPSTRPPSLSLSFEGWPMLGTVPSRDTNCWYVHYSEVKIKGLLKYKLTLLNYYFIFVTTSYIRWTMYSGNFNTPSTNTSRKTSHLHAFPFSYRLFLPQVTKTGRARSTTFVF